MDYINQIICGDCLEVMKEIPDKSVDMVFTSPSFKEKDIKGDYWKEYDKWFSEMNRICKKVVIIIHSVTKLNYLMKKYPPKRLMIWGKGYSQCTYRFNPILLYQMSDDYKINKYIWCDVFGIQSIQSKKKEHKYQDPLILYKSIIKMFRDCEIILDPFIGSGTTAIACKELNRKYIGIEISPEYCEIARRRISAIPELLFK